MHYHHSAHALEDVVRMTPHDQDLGLLEFRKKEKEAHTPEGMASIANFEEEGG